MLTKLETPISQICEVTDSKVVMSWPWRLEVYVVSVYVCVCVALCCYKLKLNKDNWLMMYEKKNSLQ